MLGDQSTDQSDDYEDDFSSDKKRRSAPKIEEPEAPFNPAGTIAAEEGKFNGIPSTKYVRIRPQVSERGRMPAMEVQVEQNIEKAMKVLKRKLIKEGLFKELKSRRFYEKPSERKKRKHKESLKKMRKEEARRRKNQTLF